tara:strand:+ start:5222 stop:6664 length:1443 start_codon:yes stop_codon:yes gene_type:complete
MLTINGYSIVKSSLDNDKLIKIKEDLTMKPRINFDIGVKKENNDNTFVLYRETEKRIYIPRYYGFCQFGLPKISKVTGGLDINVDFNGKLRDYQLEPVNKFLEAAKNPLKMGGIISVPCGFGKTIMGLYIACQLKKKTMFVSHKDFLNQQFVDTVKTFSPNANIGIIKQNKVDIENKDFIIASLQSLCMRDYDINIFNDIGFIIIDEVHHTGAQVFCRAFKKLHTPIILGLSATLNRKDGMRKVFEYYMGTSVYTMKKKEFTEVEVQIHKYYEPNIEYSGIKQMWNGRDNIAAMINNICNFKPRTEYIINVLESIIKKEPDRRILILSERRNLLNDIEKYIIDKNILNKDYGFYVGKMKQSDLNISAEKQIILATYQLASEGFNVPTLNTIIFASPISDIQQSIGRILRERPEDRKYIPLCIDILDEFSAFKRKGYARTKFYNTNKYNISYYLDNELINYQDNTTEEETKTKLNFIEDDD